MIYKYEQDVPVELRRDLNHAATFLEIAQSKFDEFRTKRARYLAEIYTEICTAVPTEALKLLHLKINFHEGALPAKCGGQLNGRYPRVGAQKPSGSFPPQAGIQSETYQSFWRPALASRISLTKVR